MSQEHVELRGSRAFELRRVDRLLAELVRPSLHEDSMAASTVDALIQLGIREAAGASRKDLIERLWDRKRTLLRQMSALSAWGPYQPIA